MPERLLGRGGWGSVSVYTTACALLGPDPNGHEAASGESGIRNQPSAHAALRADFELKQSPLELGVALCAAQVLVFGLTPAGCARWLIAQ